jgi:hypothetical protein
MTSLNLSIFMNVSTLKTALRIEPCGEATGTAVALAYVQLEDRALQDWMLEIKCLSQLGIDVNDSSLTQRAKMLNC